ncbi:hypothetical protein F2Q70_00042488 [Brassica cretica]|uniref:Uncharacterized protein n=1 Tax=Brassica cretica TaxID=69181 RepID=A0A8S9KJ01_BRACR|nr:hypothetical protein F2Q70_00042488 [Brassica cretica]
MEKSVSSVREWIAAQATAPRPTKSPAQHEPQAPVRTDIVRCNTDAAWSATTLRAGSAGTLTTQSQALTRKGLGPWNSSPPPLWRKRWP